jgi:hypothetical protein
MTHKAGPSRSLRVAACRQAPCFLNKKWTGETISDGTFFAFLTLALNGDRLAFVPS